MNIEQFQRRVGAWVTSTFGEAIYSNVEERALRIAEETIELAQSVGLHQDRLHRLVDYVYERDPGEPPQELAGTLVTLCAVANALGESLESVGVAEITRIESPAVVERCRRRQEEKRSALQTAEAGPDRPYYGVEAEQLRQGIEMILAEFDVDAETIDATSFLQLLDTIDAGQSLRWLEWRDASYGKLKRGAERLLERHRGNPDPDVILDDLARLVRDVAEGNSVAWLTETKP